VITKTVTEHVWKRKNAAKAIWLRSPSEVAEEDYAEFFKVISKGQFRSEPEALAKTHFKAEGDVEFRSILYIPKEKPFELRENSNTAMMSRIKLYVRRVFISDSFDDLIPKYLSFVIGLVDSDTLPLNVNRESLQHHASLKTIKKKLIRKTLDMMKKIADDEKRAISGEEDEEDGEDANSSSDGEVATKKYTEFWKNYGPYLKMGVIEDHANRIRLSKLLRFKSSHADFSEEGDAFTDFESYVERMKPGQKKLYYLIGGSLEELKASAFAERLVSEGYEIIYFTEPMDEYLMQHLVEFNDFKFENAAKEDLTLGDEDSKTQKQRQKQLRKAFRPFTKWWKKLMPHDLDTVKVTNRLTTSPCVVVSSKYGFTANMERIAKAQALADPEANQMYLGKKVLEVNPFHPAIKKLKELFEQDEEGEEARQMAVLMYETSLLESGFEPSDARGYAKRVYEVMHWKFGVDSEADIVDDFVYEEEEEEEEEAGVGQQPEEDFAFNFDDLDMDMDKEEL